MKIHFYHPYEFPHFIFYTYNVVFSITQFKSEQSSYIGIRFYVEKGHKLLILF